MRNIVAVKVKPKVFRNRSTSRIIPANIIATPSARRPKQAIVAKRRPDDTPPQKKITVAVSSKKARKAKRRGPQVSYKTRDTTPESLARISAIRNSKAGHILLIVGNGPSISSIPLEQLRGKDRLDTLTINRPDERLWPTTHWSFFDRSQINRHRDLWEGYNGVIFNSVSIREQKRSSMQFKYLAANGWSRDLMKGLHICRSSVYASMQIAAWMNYDRIYIIGCDMNPAGIDGKLHFYGVNPDVEPTTRARRFEKESVAYNEAAIILDDHERKKFVFCSKGINPWEFMKKFPAIAPHETVSTILNDLQGRQ